jgi:hypothetical protein
MHSAIGKFLFWLCVAGFVGFMLVIIILAFVAMTL